METETRTTIENPDLADKLAAGRPYPKAPVFGVTHARVVDCLQARRSWWLDAAQSYLDLAENGCADALHDVRRCLAQSNLYKGGPR